MGEGAEVGRACHSPLPIVNTQKLKILKLYFSFKFIVHRFSSKIFYSQAWLDPHTSQRDT